MNIDQIAPQALKLPARDRAMLAASLWESIGDPFELAVELNDQEALKLAGSRDREIESGAVQALSHDQIMARLRS